MLNNPYFLISFFFNDTATTDIYTLSLHDALPISFFATNAISQFRQCCDNRHHCNHQSNSNHNGYNSKYSDSYYESYYTDLDRKSTRLNSSHVRISYAVFCLKKKNKSLIIDYRVII